MVSCRYARLLACIITLLTGVAAGYGQTPTRYCGVDVEGFINDLERYGLQIASRAFHGSAGCILDPATGFTPLHEIASRGRSNAAQIIHALVDRYAPLLAEDRLGASALHIAAAQNSIEAAVGLCTAATPRRELGALVGMRNQQNKTALDIAEAYGYITMARLLIDHSAPRGQDESGAVDESDQDNDSPNICSEAVLNAVYLLDVGRLRAALMEFGANSADHHGDWINCLTPPEARQRTLLHLASAASGFSPPPAGRQVVQLLLDLGANASRKDATGEAPLAAAAPTNRRDVMRTILTSATSESVNNQDILGRTALHAAAAAGAQASLQQLLASGASIELRDHSGYTAKDYARREGHSNVVNAIAIAETIGITYFKVQNRSHEQQPSFVLDNRPANSEDGDSSFSVIVAAIAIVVAVCCLGGVAIVFWRWQLCGSKANVHQLPDPLVQSPAHSSRSLSSISKQPSLLKAIHSDSVDAANDASPLPPGTLGGSDSEGDVCLVKTPKRANRQQSVVVQAPNERRTKLQSSRLSATHTETDNAAVTQTPAQAVTQAAPSKTAVQQAPPAKASTAKVPNAGNKKAQSATKGSSFTDLPALPALPSEFSMPQTQQKPATRKSPTWKSPAPQKSAPARKTTSIDQILELARQPAAHELETRGGSPGKQRYAPTVRPLVEHSSQVKAPTPAPTPPRLPTPETNNWNPDFMALPKSMSAAAGSGRDIAAGQQANLVSTTPTGAGHGQRNGGFSAPRSLHREPPASHPSPKSKYKKSMVF